MVPRLSLALVFWHHRFCRLTPLIQGDTVDVLFASASIEALYSSLQRFRSDERDIENATPTELAKFLCCTREADGSFVSDLHFREVKLCGVQENILSTFKTARVTYTDSLLQCLQGRFD